MDRVTALYMLWLSCRGMCKVVIWSNHWNQNQDTERTFSQDSLHDDVIKWKHFPRHWPFVRGIHRSPVNSPHKGQWCGALMFSSISVWIKDWVNNREAGDLRRYVAHYDVTVMIRGWINGLWLGPRVVCAFAIQFLWWQKWVYLRILRTFVFLHYESISVVILLQANINSFRPVSRFT